MGRDPRFCAASCWRKNGAREQETRRMKPPRLFVEARLAEGATAELPPEQTHYLTTVLRLTAGAAVLAFNGRDGEWRARLSLDGKRKAALVCEALIRAQPPIRGPWLLFAPLKSARLDYLMQKAVEMGVSRAVPVITERTQAQRFNAGRARANMIEAAEQCGILSVPELSQETSFGSRLADWPAGRRLLFCDEEASAGQPAQTLATLPRGEETALLIGPEGGFTDAERAMLRALPGTTILSLGPRILRADTAAVAALAVFQAVCGDWAERA
jgi:16S rRNA (uracil1498-N3)-methyltransferase